MPLKLVLISPSGTLEKSGKLDATLIGDLCAAIDRLSKKGVQFAIWSNRAWTVTSQQKTVTPLHQYLTQRTNQQVHAVGVIHGGYPARRRAGSIDPILDKFAVARNEAILVGTSPDDLIAGVNNKLLLIRPDWYGVNNEYGFSVKSIAELERFCTIFGLRKYPIYWSIADASLRAVAMGPYSTKIKAYAEFGWDALYAAKQDQGSLDFWHRSIVSSLYFSGLISDIHYITTFPRHVPNAPAGPLDEVMIALGKCFRKTYFPDLLIRHTPAIKSATASAHQKTFLNQLNTIRLNAYPHAYGSGEPRKSPINLKGKNVLIVDDFCTNGRSLETARRYIEAAGGRALLFCWLKTINTSFLRMDPAPPLKPFEVNSIQSSLPQFPSGINNA
jgi:hypothetical protein